MDVTITIPADAVDAFNEVNGNVDNENKTLTAADKEAFVKARIIAYVKNHVESYYAHEGERAGKETALADNATVIDGVVEKTK